MRGSFNKESQRRLGENQLEFIQSDEVHLHKSIPQSKLSVEKAKRPSPLPFSRPNSMRKNLRSKFTQQLRLVRLR